MKINYVVEDKYDGYTLRQLLQEKFRMSSVCIKKIKLYGQLDVNGVHTRVIDRCKAQDFVYISYGDSDYNLNSNSSIPILYEDEWFAVCVKPANMVTHPTHGHLDDSLLTQLSSRSLHPVMRLDRETSGLIVVAKNGFAHNTITQSGIDKKYLAVVYGKYEEDAGTINRPIQRRAGSIMIREIANDGDGHPSITHYKSLYYDETRNISLVLFKLETGRCHQIRVHSNFMGHPLVGDGLYGPNSIDNPRSDFPSSKKLDSIIGRQALHCSYLSFFHPMTNERMTFKSMLPNDMRDMFNDLSDESINQLLSQIDRF